MTNEEINSMWQTLLNERMDGRDAPANETPVDRIKRERRG
jgi:hypothetical protein